MQRVPDEIIEHIFSFLPAHILASLSSVSKRLGRLCNKNSLWRHHCRERWRYWHPRHRIRQLLRAPAIETKWRTLYVLRERQHQEVTAHFEEVLSKQKGRILHIENITRHGYDAKDAMLNFARCLDSVRDVLARRYWANEILGSIEREVAIMTWEMAREGENVPLEHVLGSFDLWIVQQPPYELEDISTRLDSLAESFLSEADDDMDGVSQWSTRQKAAELWAFLNNFNTIQRASQTGSHRSMQHNLIGVALLETGHEISPLIAAALYCCIARRIGLDAHLTNLPLHVYINIPAKVGYDHNGHPSSDLVDPLFIEPWSGREVSSHTLKVQLARLGQPDSSFVDYLRPASTLETLNRMCNNIYAALQEFGVTFETVLLNSSTTFSIGRRQYDPGPVDDCYINNPMELNPFRAAYSLCWLRLMMRIPPNSIRALEGSEPSIDLVNRLIQHIVSHKYDISLVERYIIPRFSQNSMEHEHLSMAVSKRLRIEDSILLPTHPRPSISRGIKGPRNDFSDTVKYQIGDMFRHKRYNYTAVIIGWDPACMAGEGWIDQMGIESLPGGRQQSFYNVYVEDMSERYVAEDNIDKMGEISELQPDMPSSSLMREAGKWFKRFDSQQQRFISNIADEYPDN